MLLIVNLQNTITCDSQTPKISRHPNNYYQKHNNYKINMIHACSKSASPMWLQNFVIIYISVLELYYSVYRNPFLLMKQMAICDNRKMHDNSFEVHYVNNGHLVTGFSISHCLKFAYHKHALNPAWKFIINYRYNNARSLLHNVDDLHIAINL